MNVRVQLFAIAKQLAGRDAVELTVPDGATIAELRRLLAEAVPALTPVLPHVLFAVNSQYADETTVVAQGASVACIPPVSGG